MTAIIPTHFRYSLVLIISMLFVSGCSSYSDFNSGESVMAQKRAVAMEMG